MIERRGLDFLLFDVLQIGELTERSPFADQDPDDYRAILDLAEQVAAAEYLPSAAKADEEEPRFDGSRIHLIPEVERGLTAYRDAGFFASGLPLDVGGAGLPMSVTQSAAAIFIAANSALSIYTALTVAAAGLLAAHATADLKRLYLRPMVEGRFFGTMCLSEPQAGSSLGDIRCSAEPLSDGSWRISGTKMWISGGDHEMADNIVHLVLARTPGAPTGSKGLSLFLVPKFIVNDDGSIGRRNDVRVTGLNHKMGCRGAVNAAMAFGDRGDCVGWMVGERHQGLACMFHMMNEARIGTGLSATAIGSAGYLSALTYCRERPQGRAPAEKDPASPPVPIIRHADVKRMLLAQKAWVEGALGLVLYCTRLVDDQASHPDPEERAKAGLLLDLLTPIAKAWPAEFCLEANKLAIQCLGGYGYTRDFPVERLYRDNRLNAIHEGTNGIQAIDLLGRKVPAKDGLALSLLLGSMAADAQSAEQSEGLAEYGETLNAAVTTVRTVTAHLRSLVAEGDIELSLANASIYLNLLGHCAVGWIWLRQARVAEAKLNSANGSDAAFLRGKLSACHYFYNWEMPRIETWSTALMRRDNTILSLSEEWL